MKKRGKGKIFFSIQDTRTGPSYAYFVRSRLYNAFIISFDLTGLYMI